MFPDTNIDFWLPWFFYIVLHILNLSILINQLCQHEDEASPHPTHLLLRCPSGITPLSMSNICRCMLMYANWTLIIIKPRGLSMVFLRNYPHCDNKSSWGSSLHNDCTMLVNLYTQTSAHSTHSPTSHNGPLQVCYLTRVHVLEREQLWVVQTARNQSVVVSLF